MNNSLGFTTGTVKCQKDGETGSTTKRNVLYPPLILNDVMLEELSLEDSRKGGSTTKKVFYPPIIMNDDVLLAALDEATTKKGEETCSGRKSVKAAKGNSTGKRTKRGSVSYKISNAYRRQSVHPSKNGFVSDKIRKELFSRCESSILKPRTSSSASKESRNKNGISNKAKVTAETPKRHTRTEDVSINSASSNEFEQLEKQCGITHETDKCTAGTNLKCSSKKNEILECLNVLRQNIEMDVLRAQKNIQELDRLQRLVEAGHEPEETENKNKFGIDRKFVSSTSELRRLALNNTSAKSNAIPKAAENDVAMKKAISYYNALRSNDPVLCTPKTERILLCTPKERNKTVSINLQRQCLMLMDTPKK